jgi:signal transduction histidine kinase
MRTNDGEILNVLISGSPFYNNNNEIKGSLGIVTDINSIKNQSKVVLSAMLEGEERERKRLAQELHDGIAQYLTAINMNLSSINRNIPTEHLETLKILKKITKDSIIETRALAHNLLPKGIKQDLISSFKHLFKTFNSINSILFSLKINGERFLLSESLKFNLFRITQEFINNSIKHSFAKKKWISQLILILMQLNYYCQIVELGLMLITSKINKESV